MAYNPKFSRIHIRNPNTDPRFLNQVPILGLNSKPSAQPPLKLNANHYSRVWGRSGSKAKGFQRVLNVFRIRGSGFRAIAFGVLGCGTEAST